MISNVINITATLLKQSRYDNSLNWLWGSLKSNQIKFIYIALYNSPKIPKVLYDKAIKHKNNTLQRAATLQELKAFLKYTERTWQKEYTSLSLTDGLKQCFWTPVLGTHCPACFWLYNSVWPLFKRSREIRLSTVQQNQNQSRVGRHGARVSRRQVF